MADARRRRALAHLTDRSGRIPERELTADLVADERSSGSSGAAAVERRHAALRHVHLPRLDDAGLVSWDRSAGTVAAADHPSLEDPRFLSVLEATGDEVSAVVECVADERRRSVLSVLDAGRGRLRRRTLARAVVGRGMAGTPPAEAVAGVGAELHHVHLPKLDDAGLVDYDADGGTVRHRGVPDLPGRDLFAECYG